MSEESSARVVILGDIGASVDNEAAFASGDASMLLDEKIISLLKESDIRIANIEKPLTDCKTPLGLCPPDFRASVETANFFSAINLTAASLANNHILDQKSQGVASTISALNARGIQTVGAGMNLEEAGKGIFLERNGVRIGIYSCAEHEFSIASEHAAGANPFDPMESLDHIAELRANCDTLLILFHGGTQGYPYPTPFQRKICRKMCDRGADLVVCQHSHCIGCEEKYRGSTIVYGQGNFIIDNIDDPSWKTGLIITAVISKTGKPVVSYNATHRCTYGAMHAEDNYDIVKSFSERGKQIESEEFVQSAFRNHCKEMEEIYFSALVGLHPNVRRVLRRLNLLRYIPRLYAFQQRNRIYNYIVCETHREAITELVKNEEIKG